MTADAYLKAVRLAARRRVAAEHAFRTAVFTASIEGGKSLREIADVAGMSHVGVLKIVRGVEAGEGRG